MDELSNLILFPNGWFSLFVNLIGGKIIQGNPFFVSSLALFFFTLFCSFPFPSVSWKRIRIFVIGIEFEFRRRREERRRGRRKEKEERKEEKEK